ncbi:glycosyltransferase family A protein [Jejudonia soesokkakensis]|uniref:Glycosyltransferase family A protein n=1 Tax=Jejudonia soesokkakensis TaxID=1323432 RepID=A0ABW2MQ71_9FLAO
MRIGQNPENNKKIVSEDVYHHIIVPVYVPRLDDYFKDSYKITRLCIGSINATRHYKSKLTIVNNGSCDEITSYLNGLYASGFIDQLIHHKTNKGKIDAVIPVAKQATEALITITDGDVLFKPGWMDAVERVYVNFPKAGMVSPVPHGTLYNHFTAHTLYDAFFRGLLKFQKLCDPEAMLLFAKSIDKETTMYAKSIRLQYQLTLRKKNANAIVGCGHFVATLRKEVFKKTPKVMSHWAYSSSADRDYIDIPNEKSGFWRLATPENYAYHMGNIHEEWMDEVTYKPEQKQVLHIIPKAQHNFIPYFVKKVFVRILMSRYVKPWYFKKLGLVEGYKEY